jgi:hypothetical protein
MDRYQAQMRRIRAHPEQIRASSSANVVKCDHINAERIGKNPKKSAEPREPGGIDRRQSPVTTPGFAPRMVEESRDASRLPKAAAVIQSLVRGQKESSPRFGVVYPDPFHPFLFEMRA